MFLMQQYFDIQYSKKYENIKKYTGRKDITKNLEENKILLCLLFSRVSKVYEFHRYL